MHKNLGKFLLCLLAFCLLSVPGKAEVLTGVGVNTEDSTKELKARAWISEHVGVDATLPVIEGPTPTITPMVRGEQKQSVVPYIGVEFSWQDQKLKAQELVAGLEINLTKDQNWRLAVEMAADSKDATTTVSLLVDLDTLLSPKTPPKKPSEPSQPPKTKPSSPQPPKAKTAKPKWSLNEDDVMLLARLISAEARGEPYLGQVAVGGVVLNRVKSPLFPNSVRAVIYQPGQFSPVSDGTINRPPTESAIRAARAALSGQDPSGGALYFYNPKLSSATGRRYMQTKTVTVRIGNHIFAK